MRLLGLLLLFLSAGYMAYADIHTRQIPSRALFAAFLAAGLTGVGTVPFPGSLFLGLLRGLIFTLPLFFLVLLYERVRKKQAIGGGDLKMILVLGMHFPFAVNMFGLLFSAGIGCIFGLLNRRFSTEKRPFPLAPALLTGWLLAALFEGVIMNFWRVP